MSWGAESLTSAVAHQDVPADLISFLKAIPAARYRDKFSSSARIERSVATGSLSIAKLQAAVIGMILAAAPAQAAPVLRVGVADGAQPCSYRQQGSWSGMAVELWQRIANEEKLPYVLVTSQSAATLLAATQRGELDVAIGFLTVSPERLRSHRFSLPFQETGLGVMTRRTRLDLGYRCCSRCCRRI
jgi:ABC-type amino acid transport substrate-binding protein